MERFFLKLILISCVINYSCSKYLDVQPKSSVSEDQMFSSEIGFQQALVGAYSQMSKQELYGDRLSLGFVSALAQNYTQSAAGAPYYETVRLNYASDEVKQSLLQIWGSGYNAIAGLNKILEKAESNRGVLSTTGYQQIMGEALALRAYIHFDLYRLFGPAYHSGKGDKAIPFETQVNVFANVPSTSEELCKHILQDLARATALLKQSDPVFSVTDNMPKRRVKMNYYAAKALEARVNLYVGEKNAAATAAQEVVQSGKFLFVKINEVNTSAGTKNRLFTSEMVFGVRSRNILSWTENYFKFNRSAGYSLTRSVANINTIYESNATDLRRQYLFELDQTVLYPSKFWQTYTPLSDEGLTSTRRLDQLVPLIRLSEMYYILAETANNANAGIVYLNEVRKARNLNIIPENQVYTDSFLESELRKEYQKEFYGEGQFFFYLKRKDVRRLPFMNADVPLNVYRLPIPDVELEYNPTYE